MTKINAKVVADSLSPQGDRLTSLLITFPRIILSEVNTHRMLSKNTSSSRAIPFNKMLEAVQENPFITIAWQKHHSGMQGNEYLSHPLEIKEAEQMWRRSLDCALSTSKDVYKSGVTKQLCNRLLEPFMWCTVLVTGMKESFDNMFDLRCPSYEFDTLEKGKLVFKSWKEAIRECSNISKTFTDNDLKNLENTTVLEKLSKNKGQTEIHFMDLAEKIYDAMNESTPKQLKAGEYHIPFEDKIDTAKIDLKYDDGGWAFQSAKVKISTAMAARTSYTVVGDEKEFTYEQQIALHDRMANAVPFHASPFEHCARAMNNAEYNNSFKGKEKGWFRNYKGFKSYRQILEEC